MEFSFKLLGLRSPPPKSTSDKRLMQIFNNIVVFEWNWRSCSVPKWIGPIGIMLKITLEVFWVCFWPLTSTFQLPFLQRLWFIRTYVGNGCLHFPSARLALTSSKKWLCSTITGSQLYGAIRKQCLPTFQIMSLKVCHPVEGRASLYWGPPLRLKVI